jgi:hypothetical protein
MTTGKLESGKEQRAGLREAIESRLAHLKANQEKWRDINERLSRGESVTIETSNATANFHGDEVSFLEKVLDALASPSPVNEQAGTTTRTAVTGNGPFDLPAEIAAPTPLFQNVADAALADACAEMDLGFRWKRLLAAVRDSGRNEALEEAAQAVDEWNNSVVNGQEVTDKRHIRAALGVAASNIRALAASRFKENKE